MFCCVLSRCPDIARRLVELILGFEVERVEIVDSQKVLNYSSDSHSIRLDVYMKNDSEVFDVEMQTIRSDNLPKRMRYYHSAIACEDLSPGDDYNELKNCYVIFICLFDPFRKGEAIYRFSMKSDRHRDLDLNDGAYDILINCMSEDPQISKELEYLLKYLKSGEAVDNFTSKIQNEVDKVNKDPY